MKVQKNHNNFDSHCLLINWFIYLSYFAFFPPIFIKWKENHVLKSPEPDDFSMLTCQLKMSDFSSCANGQLWPWTFFNHQFIAYLPQNVTEIVRFLKTFKNCFSWKNSRVFSKRNWIFTKLQRWQICCRMRIKSYDFLKMSFPPQLLGSSSENSENFHFGKIRKYNEEKEFFEKSFHPFKRRLHQNEKAENKPLVPGRLVSCSTSITTKKHLVVLWFQA